MTPVEVPAGKAIPRGYRVVQELPDGRKLVVPAEKPRRALDRLREALR